MPLPVEFFRLYGGEVTIKSMDPSGSERMISTASPHRNVFKGRSVKDSTF